MPQPKYWATPAGKNGPPAGMWSGTYIPAPNLLKLYNPPPTPQYANPYGVPEAPYTPYAPTTPLSCFAKEVWHAPPPWGSDPLGTEKRVPPPPWWCPRQMCRTSKAANLCQSMSELKLSLFRRWLVVSPSPTNGMLPGVCPTPTHFLESHWC